MLAINAPKEPNQSHYRDGIAQATPNFEGQLSMLWETLPAVPRNIYQTSAIIDGQAYFASPVSIYAFSVTNMNWSKLSDSPVVSKGIFGDPSSMHYISLVSIENELTVVGGRFLNWLYTKKVSNKLYSYVEGKWVEKYPPMPTKRYSCTAVYTSPVLIVAGGHRTVGDVFDPDVTLKVVEILNIYSKQWSKAASLPFSAAYPSVSVCSEYIYVHDASARALLEAQDCTVRYPLISLILSAPMLAIWEKVASLPVMMSTLVSVKGHLLAVGGKYSEEVITKEIRQYNPKTDSWQVVSQMKVARSQCAVALLPDNKLMVVGGASKEEPNELATFY